MLTKSNDYRLMLASSLLKNKPSVTSSFMPMKLMLNKNYIRMKKLDFTYRWIILLLLGNIACSTTAQEIKFGNGGIKGNSSPSV
jgi:hypothetical protein